MTFSLILGFTLKCEYKILYKSLTVRSGGGQQIILSLSLSAFNPELDPARESWSGFNWCLGVWMEAGGWREGRGSWQVHNDTQGRQGAERRSGDIFRFSTKMWSGECGSSPWPRPLAIWSTCHSTVSGYPDSPRPPGPPPAQWNVLSIINIGRCDALPPLLCLFQM